jgi:hypothetical protein
MLDELTHLEDPFVIEPAIVRLLEEQPDLELIRRWWIGTLATSERWTEAIPHLQALLAGGAGDARAQVQLGLLLGRSGDREGSVRHMLQAAELDAANPDPWRWLCRVGAEERRWNEVAEFSDSILVRAPEDPEGLRERARRRRCGAHRARVAPARRSRPS